MSDSGARRRTLLVVQSPYWNCGPAQSMLQHLRHLDATRFRAIMVCPSDHPFLAHYRPHVGRLDFVSGTRIPPRTVHVLRLSGYGAQLGWAVLRLAALIRRERVDLVHNNADSSLAAGLAARLCGIPAVTHCRGMAVVRPPWVGRTLVPLLARAYDRIIAVSESVREALLPFCPTADKIVVVHNAVDPEEFRPLPTVREKLAAEWGVSPAGPWIGTIGGLGERKGQEYFVRAAARIRSRRRDASFFVIGAVPAAGADESPYAERIRRLAAELGLDDALVFTGERSDIPRWLNAFDVVVQPSLTDAGPRVPLEAMACGRPVVATRLEGNAEEVMDGVTGLLVDPASEEALAAAVLRLLDDDGLRRDMGAAGLQRVRERFTITVQVRQIERLYDALVEAGSGSAPVAAGRASG